MSLLYWGFLFNGGESGAGDDSSDPTGPPTPHLRPAQDIPTSQNKVSFLSSLTYPTYPQFIYPPPP